MIFKFMNFANVVKKGQTLMCVFKKMYGAFIN